MTDWWQFYLASWVQTATSAHTRYTRHALQAARRPGVWGFALGRMSQPLRHFGVSVILMVRVSLPRRTLRVMVSPTSRLRT